MLYCLDGESGFLETQANRIAHPFGSLLGLASRIQPLKSELALQLLYSLKVARLLLFHFGFMAALCLLERILQESILVG